MSNEEKETKEKESKLSYPTRAEGYEIQCEIGVGAFATVFRAQVKGRDEPVAIKMVNLDQFNTNWEEIRKEISTMSLLHHSNVVRIHTSFVEGEELWIVMPLLAGGSCASIMKQLFPNGMKDEALIATILMEVLKGLEYFHKDGRIHRDIKAGNILISEKGEVQLADFGVAASLVESGDRKKNRQTFTGTPCWMAPEVMEQTKGYDTKADMWSLGITAMELGFGRAPYAQYQPMKVLLLTLQEDPPTCDIYKDDSYKFSKHYHSLIKKCLRKDPTRRPNATKLLRHKFFKKARDAQYIVEKLVKNLPPQDLSREQIHSEQRTMTALGAQTKDKSKPVSIGSWVFDKEEWEQMKKDLEQQKKRIKDSPSESKATNTAQVPTGSKTAQSATTAATTAATTTATSAASTREGTATALGMGVPQSTASAATNPSTAPPANPPVHTSNPEPNANIQQQQMGRFQVEITEEE